MHGVVLDVHVVDGRAARHVCDFDEVVGLDAPACVAADAVPPGGAVAVEHRRGLRRDFNVGAADDDERVVGCRVLPERGSGKGDFAAALQLGEVDGAVAWDADVVEGDGRAGGYCGGDLRVLGYIAYGVGGW